MGKKQKSKNGSRLAPIILGAILVICSMIPISANLFGQTGRITEITSVERFGGELEGNPPNRYKWDIAYKFKMENGEIGTGSITVIGSAISAKSGLTAGSPVRYLAFAPRINNPGAGGFGGSTIMYAAMIGFGVFLISLGVRKEKPPKTPAQRSREYRAAKKNQPPSVQKPVYNSGGDKMFCENCGTQLNEGVKFCNNCGASQQTLEQTPQPEPDWDSFEYDNETPITGAEADELYGIATEEEIEEEFDLINSGDEGPAYYRKVLAIVRWRRANGQ